MSGPGRLRAPRTGAGQGQGEEVGPQSRLPLGLSLAPPGCYLLSTELCRAGELGGSCSARQPRCARKRQPSISH